MKPNAAFAKKSPATRTRPSSHLLVVTFSAHAFCALGYFPITAPTIAVPSVARCSLTMRCQLLVKTQGQTALLIGLVSPHGQENVYSREMESVLWLRTILLKDLTAWLDMEI